MNIPDDILMAFADGELDEATRRMVETAERDDPDVRRRLATHRQLRARLQTAFAATLEEPAAPGRGAQARCARSSLRSCRPRHPFGRPASGEARRGGPQNFDQRLARARIAGREHSRGAGLGLCGMAFAR